MKQIDEILDNLARSVGLEIKIISSPYLEITFENYRRGYTGMVSNIEQAKISFLNYLIDVYGSHLDQKILLIKNKEYKLNLEKLIFEPVEEELLPCVYCNEKTGITREPGVTKNFFYVECTFCRYQSEDYQIEQSAILNHNEIYRKVHGEK